jgi:hypothetical protein
MEDFIAALLGCYGANITTRGVERTLKESLHPIELSFVQSALPMGQHYDTVSHFVDDWEAGQVLTLLGSGIARGASVILDEYQEAVTSLTTPHDAVLLQNRFKFTLTDVSAMALATDYQIQNKLLTTFLASFDRPVEHRLALSRECGSNVLLATAHWVAHGTLVAEEFISCDAEMREFAVNIDALPLGMSEQLAALILTTGQIRRQLLYDHPEGQLDDYARVQDTQLARQEVFNSIFDPPSLIVDGMMVWEELESRVSLAHTRWSANMWEAIRRRSNLGMHLDALRWFFLGQRGDLWHAFVDGAFPTL